jgi:hypothetical protein
MALTMAKEELPAQLTREWLGEVVEDVLLEAAEDERRPELQEDIERLFRAIFSGPRQRMGFGESLEATQSAPDVASEGTS